MTTILEKHPEMKLKLPADIERMFDVLREAGHTSYAFGACVLSTILGEKSRVWNIVTTASPNEISKLFINDNGEEDEVNQGCEGIVCIRISSPDTAFGLFLCAPSLVNDEGMVNLLEQQTLTINAVAYNPDSGVISGANALDDIRNGIIRATKNSMADYFENPHCLLYALRAASVYGYGIEAETADAINKNASVVTKLWSEMQYGTEAAAWLKKTLNGRNVLYVFSEFKDVIAALIPELGACIGVEQNKKWHEYDVYDHTIHAIDNYPGCDSVISLALLLHDIGKPLCRTNDTEGAHFHAHGEKSAELAKAVLKRFAFAEKGQDKVVELVRYHDEKIEPTKESVTEWVNRLGCTQFDRLLCIRKADILAHKVSSHEYLLDKLNKIVEVYKQLLLEGAFEAQEEFI